ncbi:uncharacterized protein LOC124260703 [Haliotis rubra]|uniref:uncharacterized protein LOC124260703 n=1 Tax=Haliotis rubra TaxID=36100 RepID=UPI001EE4FC93|nr:uncharacterized protein LOC124260703 [Haliotis rubra]
MQNDSMEVTASFMDDPTETEVSESDRGQRSQKREGRDNRNVGRHDQTSEGYSGEEDTDATPKPSTRLKISQKSENKESTSPSKPQRKSRTLASEEEEEITPRATPTRGMQVSRYVSSSDMETPRSVQARTRQTAPPRSGVSRASPAGRQLDRTEEHARRGSDRGQESDATRVSSASGSRLRALQDEVERLKERVEQAVESPPQAPLPPPQSQPEYYDPFDDPYGFMRMPRRRANSFSGTNTREWDEWYWTLPNQRRNDGSDIPLGYAAADAYADAAPHLKLRNLPAGVE